jgi:hypothetical protein
MKSNDGRGGAMAWRSSVGQRARRSLARQAGRWHGQAWPGGGVVKFGEARSIMSNHHKHRRDDCRGKLRYKTDEEAQKEIERARIFRGETLSA